MNIEKQKILSKLREHSTHIFNSIAEHYLIGDSDSPKLNHYYMTLLAMLIEGKIAPVESESTGEVRWSLTDGYLKEIDESLHVALSDNVYKGPW